MEAGSLKCLRAEVQLLLGLRSEVPEVPEGPEVPKGS